MGTYYLRWLSANPVYILCSPRTFTLLGPTLFGGIPLVANCWCPDSQLFGIGDQDLLQGSSSDLEL